MSMWRRKLKQEEHILVRKLTITMTRSETIILGLAGSMIDSDHAILGTFTGLLTGNVKLKRCVMMRYNTKHML